MAADRSHAGGDGVVVLGGTAGIGWETAAQFAEQGCRVALIGRDAAKGEAACASLRSRVAGAEVHYIEADASDAEAAAQAAADAAALLGGIDVLVCASGGAGSLRLVHQMRADTIAITISSFVLPPLHLCHAVLPGMRAAGRGAVVLVASDAARVPTPGESVIGAAMAAITMFGKTLALEAKRDGVRVNILTPSLVANTPGAERIEASPFAAKIFAKAAQQASLGVAEPEDLAAMAVFLAGPGAAKVTGQVIRVNGGISIA